MVPPAAPSESAVATPVADAPFRNPLTTVKTNARADFDARDGTLACQSTLVTTNAFPSGIVKLITVGGTDSRSNVTQFPKLLPLRAELACTVATSATVRGARLSGLSSDTGKGA